jgi:FkbM family methyltransferase
MSIHPDLPLLIGLSACALAYLLTRNPARIARLTVLVLVVGVVFSAHDQHGTSIYGRARILAEKALGGLPNVAWSNVTKEVFGPRTSFQKIDVDKWVTVIDRKPGPVGELELYRTPLGEMWASATSRESMAFGVKEMTALAEYEIEGNQVQPGDTVIDCGAHVGLYTKLALSRGAGLVVAVEPDPENYWCFRESLRDEIAKGRVQVFQVGVWNERDSLTFSHSKDNPGAHGFFERGRPGNAIEYENVPVVALEDLVTELALDRVDWIKMDIEGAERQALAGAAGVLKNFKPRMAICTYHRDDDAVTLPSIVLAANSTYSLSAKRIVTGGTIRPKVLFFH